MNYRTPLLTALGVAAFVATPSLAANSHDQMDHSKMDHSEMDMTGMCDMPMGEGVINALDVKKSTVNLTHKPIEAIGWPEMTMDFAVLKPVDLSA
ncbi:copper-binding protein, partial [Hyphococcus sp.]|uniref:copper-binding protein n=1 Tax=Hyphococcus sp. TaxID=2038636 RepID=UPI0037537742